MQKLINVLAVTSFLVSGAVVAGGSYVYVNRAAIIEDVKEKALEEVTSILPSLLPVPQIPGIAPSAGFAGDGGGSPTPFGF